MRRALRLGAVIVLVLVVAAIVPPVRRAALRGVGRSLVTSDALEPGDVMDAGEGGPTASTPARGAWARAHPSRLLVVIGAAHSRRYRRALLRVWPSAAPPPRVTYPQRTLFRPEVWWTYRRSLREGLLE